MSDDLLTPERLTRLLREAGALAGGRVASVQLEEIGIFSTRLCRMRLAYDPPSISRWAS